MKPVSADITALVNALAVSREQLTLAATQFVLAHLQVMGNDSWYDHDEIRVLVQKITVAVMASQRQTAALTDAFLARTLSVILDKPVRAVGPVRVDNLRRGVLSGEVYGRLADSYRYLRSTGVEESEAASRVSHRATVMVDTDNFLAFRAQVEKSFAPHKEILGYRRVVHPEQSRDGSCGLCIVASDRVYSRGNLLDMHVGCKCTVLPITRVAGVISDPGADLNRDDLNAIYAAAGGNTRIKLKKVRVSYHDHGELGPVIGYRGQRFRSDSDVKKSTNPDTGKKAS
jgi:hypothetical protein